MSGEVPMTYSIKEAAEHLSCSVSTVRAYLRRGKIRSAQPGSSGRHARGGAPHRIPADDIAALLEARRLTEVELVERRPARDPSPVAPTDAETISRELAQKLTGFSRSTIIRREGHGLTPYRDGKRVTYRLSDVLALCSAERRAAYEAEKRTAAEKTRATYAPNPEVQRE